MVFSMRKRIVVFVSLVCAICLVGAAKPPERIPTPSTGAPGTPRIVGVTLKDDGDFLVTWRAATGDVTSYVLEAGPSRFAREDLWQTALVVKGANTCSATVSASDAYSPENPYECYFRVRAQEGKGKKAVKGNPSEALGIEMTLFGDHTYVFAETDDAATIDRTLEELFEQQNDRQNKAEFKAEHFQVYFKAGDYTQCACMNVGFYTAFGGLGKVPTDTRLNNIAVPPYLDDNNATCDFWRSVENVSVCDTGNGQGLAGYESMRPEQFNWAVAQAAPLRRIYSERPLAYDWNYGWASGGFLADSRVVGYFDDNGSKRSAGTTTGQQFYTRNTEFTGAVYGITLNAVYQGVIAPNLPGEDTGTELYDGRGYSDWAISGTTGGNNWDYWQQCVTNVTKTSAIREKPFLYVEDGEYRVFVPALRKDAVGPSWEEDDMGPGTSLSLADDFYVASPSDSAAFINKRIAAGKSIYFTPGVYHVDEPIVVDRPDTVLLGSGLASIVPEKGGSAVQVGDVEGVTVAGLMFDAGPQHSENLLQVGTERQPHASVRPVLPHRGRPRRRHECPYRAADQLRPCDWRPLLVVARRPWIGRGLAQQCRATGPGGERRRRHRVRPL